MANTVSVTAGSTIVAGDVTAFVGAAGDLFILNGLACPIASVDSASKITLAFPWPGATLAGQTRWLVRNDGPHWSSVVTLNQQLADLIPSVEGELDDLSQQVAGKQANLGFVPARQSDLQATNVTVAGKQATLGFVPARQSDLDATNVTVAGKQANLGFVPVQQNGGAGHGTNKIYLGWGAGGKLKAQVDVTDLGAVWTDYSAPSMLAAGGYQKLPNGMIMQWIRRTFAGVADAAITWPIAFPNSLLAATSTVEVGDYDGATLYAVRMDNLTFSGGNFRVRVAANGGVVQATAGAIVHVHLIGW